MKNDHEQEAEEKQAEPQAADARPDATEDKQQGPRVAPSVKPGFLTRTWQACCAPFANIKLPAWNLLLFSRALSMIVLLAVGFLVGWLSRSPRREQESESEE